MSRLFSPGQRLHPGKLLKISFYNMSKLPIQHCRGGRERKNRIRGEQKGLDSWGGAGGGRR